MTEIKVRETINLELLKDSCLPHERKQNTIHNILRNWELSSEKTSQRTEEKESKARFNYDDLTTYRLFIRLNLTMLLPEVAPYEVAFDEIQKSSIIVEKHFFIRIRFCPLYPKTLGASLVRFSHNLIVRQ